MRIANIKCAVKHILSFSEQIKAVRKAHKLSQEDFADKIGLPYRTYQTIEQGKTTRITADALCILANLGVDLYSLVGSKQPDIVQSSKIGGLTPPMFDDTPQDWVSVGPAFLADLGADAENLRLFYVDQDYLIRPPWGIGDGDLVFVDTSKVRPTGRGLYLVRLVEGDNLRPQELLAAPGRPLCTVDISNGPDGVSAPPMIQIEGKIVGRVGSVKRPSAISGEIASAQNSGNSNSDKS